MIPTVAAALVIALAAPPDDSRPDAGSPDAGAPEPAPDAAAPDAEALPLVPVPAPAPPRATLRGLVLEKGTRAPLAGAAVTVDALAAGETDAAGRFAVEVAPGRRRISVQQPGHEVLSAAVDVPAGGADETFRVAPRLDGERYETVISPPPLEAPRVALDKQEALHTPGSAGDPFRVIESLPGVTQVLWPLAIYAIRGANPGNTGFFIDELRVPAIFHLAAGPSVIHPYFLEGIDFYPGGTPARYGRYASGSVAARTVPAPIDRVHASADARLYDAGGIVTSPWADGAGSVAAAGRISYTGLLFSILSPDLTLGYGDYQLRADRRAGGGRATVFVFGSADRLGHKTSAVDDASLDFHRIDLRWERRGAGGRFQAAIAAGYDHSATTYFESPIAVRAVTLGPRLLYERLLAGWASLSAGADAEAQRFWPKVPEPHPQLADLTEPRSVYSAGAHATLVLTGGDRLVIAPGFRADAFVEGDAGVVEPEPRLAIRVRPAGETWLKAAGGRSAQMASLPISVPGFEGFDLAGGTQRAWQASAGVETPLPGRLSLDATGFLQRYEGLSDLASIFAKDVRQPGFLVRRPGLAYGAELLVRRRAGRLDGWIAYTLSRSLREFEGGVVGASDWDQRHILNLVANVRLRGGYGLGGRVHYNTGRPYPVYPNSVIEYERLPPFYQLDLRADRRFVLDRSVVDVYVEVLNATATKEIVSISYETGERAEAGYRIVLPSIGVHAEF